MSKVITRGFGSYPLVVTRGFGIEYIPKLVLVSLDCLIQTARELVCGILTAVNLVARIQKERTV